MVGSKNKIFLIVDNGPRACPCIEADKGIRYETWRPTSFVLSPAIFAGQKPGRTSLEASQSRHCRTDDDNELHDFKTKVKSSMISLQRRPEKIRSFFQKPSLKYAARMSTYFCTY
jgi:hypothetical protein